MKLCTVVNEEWVRLFMARNRPDPRRSAHRRCAEWGHGDTCWSIDPRAGRFGSNRVPSFQNWCCCVGHTPWFAAHWTSDTRREAAAPQLKLSRKLGLRLGRCVGTDPRELDALFGRCGDDLCIPTPDNPGDPDALAAH